jgi:ribosomal protein S18 acetylase RimI-like enzyme
MMCECNLVLLKVQDEREIEQLRLIRNACKNFMTRNTSEISKEQQLEWYKNIDKNFNKLYLLYDVIHGVALTTIGYGYIRVEDGAVLLTGGLIESERGKGYGSILFNHLVKNSKVFNLPIKLELLKTNMVAFSIYNKIGFRVIGDDGKIIKMEYHYDSVI